METRKSFLTDMDGVLVHGRTVIPGAPEFIARLIGTESGLETVWVLTGVSTREMVARFPYQPSRIVESVADLP